jgi:hypothetical protein
MRDSSKPLCDVIMQHWRLRHTARMPQAHGSPHDALQTRASHMSVPLLVSLRMPVAACHALTLIRLMQPWLMCFDAL